MQVIALAEGLLLIALSALLRLIGLSFHLSSATFGGMGGLVDAFLGAPNDFVSGLLGGLGGVVAGVLHVLSGALRVHGHSQEHS